jgi:lysophosphatidylcholine acyltransferase/lyso-PAF acetyltransferase
MDAASPAQGAAVTAASSSSPSVASPLPEGYVSLPADSPLRVQARVVDPYEEQEEFDLPWLGRILLFLIDIVLVPLRIIGAVLLLVVLWALCGLLTLGARPAHRAGDAGFGCLRTACIRAVVRLIAKPFCWCFGLWVSHKTHPLAQTQRGILLCNHIGYVEILILVALYAPSVVAKAEIASYPLIGTVARAMQCVFVDRKDPADRERVRLLLLDRAHAEPGRFPPLLLFPEGTTGNGAALLRMQKGIFAAGAPVQILAAKTHFCFYNSGWTLGSMGKHVLGLLTRLYHPVSLTELPLYVPSAAEQADAILYADNVAMTLANRLRQPLTNKTMFDNPELIATIKHRQHKAAVNAAREGTAAATTTAAGQAAPQGGDNAEVRINIQDSNNVASPSPAADSERSDLPPQMRTAKVSPMPLAVPIEEPQQLRQSHQHQSGSAASDAAFSAAVTTPQADDAASSPVAAASSTNSNSSDVPPPPSARRQGWAETAAQQQLLQQQPQGPEQQQQQQSQQLPPSFQQPVSARGPLRSARSNIQPLQVCG